MGNVGGVFLVLIYGCVAAFFIAIMEFLWNTRKVAIDNKVSDVVQTHLIFEIRRKCATNAWAWIGVDNCTINHDSIMNRVMCTFQISVKEAIKKEFMFAIRCSTSTKPVKHKSPTPGSSEHSRSHSRSPEAGRSLGRSLLQLNSLTRLSRGGDKDK